MTEAEKQGIKSRVAALLDSNERIRVTDLVSLRETTNPRTDNWRRFEPGDEKYFVIAVGRETDNEKMALRLLSSVVSDGGWPERK